MEAELIFFVVMISVAGAALGTFTGLVPGIHVNTLAVIMISFYPLLSSALSEMFPSEYVPILVASCIVSAAVVHSFVDFVPSVFLGAPDPDEVLNVLPGHRMLLEGNGMIAVRSAAIGSLVGSMVAVIVAIPMQLLLTGGFGEYLESITFCVLLITVIVMITRESGTGMIWALALFLISGALGIVCMFIAQEPVGIVPGGNLLLPLLTGLFGMPAMLLSLNNGEVPEQKDEEEFPVGPGPGIKGALAGGIVGWFPGITSTAGAVLATSVLPEKGSEKFISLVASIGSASTVFALVTLSVTGNGRTGTMLAAGEVLGDSLSGFGNGIFILMLLSVAVASLLGYAITIRSGRSMAGFVRNRDMNRMNRIIIVLMVILVALMTGTYGLLILLASTAAGLIPTSTNVSRVHLSGCLILPVLLLNSTF